jgi:phage terminase large subunit
VVTRTKALIHEFNLSPYFVGVDGVGLGTGVIDFLIKDGYNVVEIIGGSKPVEIMHNLEVFTPANLKTQMYLELAKDMREGNLGGVTDQKLIYELSSVRYEIMAEKTIRVLPKEVLKKLIGNSPDFADSLAIANWCKTYRGGSIGGLPLISGD